MEHRKEIPEGKLKRGGLIGLTATRAGIKKIGHIAREPFVPEEKKDLLKEQNNEEIAKLIFRTLSSLRGTALKAAQMASLEMEIIPEAYRKELSKASSSVPPINRALIRKILVSRFNAQPENIFRQFDSTPFAAASLGQVHRAVSEEGEELAVKVQYPGISSSVKSDIEMLKLLLRPTRYFKIFKYCFDEVEEKVLEELDYLNEAENTAWFREHLKVKNIVVPKTYPELSTGDVLTTSLLKGIHLEEWLETGPSQEERDLYGQLLVDLFHYMTYDLKVIHADPNPGNYLFMEKGELGVLDFGCVKKLDEELLRGIYSIYYNETGNDTERIKENCRDIGIYYRESAGNSRFSEFFLEWIEWITRPRRSEWFDFSKETDYFNEGLGKIREFYSYISYFNGSFTYFGRTEYGLFRLLQSIGARVRMRPGRTG
jgi:predicted unusual protein kinase regulating ubiquinone biosynthesis (AarF/ABC1/UbiB family)